MRHAPARSAVKPKWLNDAQAALDRVPERVAEATVIHKLRDRRRLSIQTARNRLAQLERMQEAAMDFVLELELMILAERGRAARDLLNSKRKT